MQRTVRFEEQRPTGSFSDRRGDSVVAEIDEMRPVGDHTAPPAALTQRPVGGWISKIARAFLGKGEDRNRLEHVADHQLSKGSAKRLYLANGARVSCRRGKVWITLDEGGEDIVLAASESRSFGPGARVLVEALATSRISLENL